MIEFSTIILALSCGRSFESPQNFHPPLYTHPALYIHVQCCGIVNVRSTPMIMLETADSIKAPYELTLGIMKGTRNWVGVTLTG